MSDLAGLGHRLRGLQTWFRSGDWWSWDLWIGACVAALLGLASMIWPVTDLGRDEIGAVALPAVGAAAIAVLSAVLAVLAIFTAFLSRSYRKLVTEIEGSFASVVRPFGIVAAGAAVASLAAFVAQLLWPAIPGAVRVPITCLAAGTLTWLVIGALQLVGVTMQHLALTDRWDEILDQKRTDSGRDGTHDQEKPTNGVG